jgi:hypothetical protein
MLILDKIGMLKPSVRSTVARRNFRLSDSCILLQGQ